MPRTSRLFRTTAFAALAACAMPLPVLAQQAEATLNEAEYFEAPAVNYLVFSNWYDGLFADSKISGVEIIQQDRRIATNGDVRLSATPGQWDAIGRMVKRTVDPATGTITAELEYPDYDFRYTIRAVPTGSALQVSIILPEALPAALQGKAGFNLEFLPSAYSRTSYMADGKAGGLPLYPSSTMEMTDNRNAASGRNDGPGAEPMPLATGSRIVMAPSDPALRVAITSNAPLALYDGRDQAQNGWFVLRSLLPAGRTGEVLTWTVQGTPAPDWLRTPSIGHSQLGYVPGQAKIATVELDANDTRRPPVELVKVAENGALQVVRSGTGTEWGDYLRYKYLRFDFSDVTAPGLYLLRYGDQQTAPFRIDADLYRDAWHPTLDVYFPVQMDHMFVNEGYRVWHGLSHMDDALQAPINHEHIDLYAQGPTTDTKFAPGEHIPGLNVGGWYDAGDFDIRTQSQYAVVRSMVRSWEDFGLDRDTTSVDQDTRRVEIHVPDGKPDLLQQIQHGTLQLVAQFDAVGHAINGIVAPDVAQYTHLGDAGSKTDNKIEDPSLEPYQVVGDRSGTHDDRWAFTNKSSALNYGSIAALAAASRALKDMDPALSAKARAIALRVWDEEAGKEPDTYSFGNTTGGPLEAEKLTAAVELLKSTGDAKYQRAIEEAWPGNAQRFRWYARTLAEAVPHMPASYRERMVPLVQAWIEENADGPSENPYGVPIGRGGWAGNGGVIGYGLTTAALHREFPDIVPPDAVFRSLDYLLGNHPGSDISFVSGVGTKSKEVAYGFNRADHSFIAGGVVPGVLIIKPDFPENHEDWPFFWGQNEYVIPVGSDFIELVNTAHRLANPDD